MRRYRIEVSGIVQGVGFRPFIHKLVCQYGFAGWVRNSSSGAELELEGEAGDIELFISALRNDAPPLALIESVKAEALPELFGYTGFEIKSSDKKEQMQTLVSPDVGICPDCLNELCDPTDRRYRYPFINCTNCGPRFTIIKYAPYDRASTAMESFPMCPQCASEYSDIRDRRYHAQPDCCPDCGPRTFFIDNSGARQPGDAIKTARDYLKSGRIVAIKGLGGIHLACDASDAELCRELRRRKQRDEKPFAVMCRDLDCVRELCELSVDEERFLSSHRRPIVLLKKRERGGLSHLSENDYIGVMLPYTPLHYLAFDIDINYLVMTSANLSDTPIMYGNEEALRNLSQIADGFLLHNRDIQTRCDDSLIRVFEGREYPLRRSRGYVPYPVLIPEARGGVLACGAEQKASFCIGKPGHAFPSQHIGDLKNAETLDSYEGQIAHFERLFDVELRAIACDLHPDYFSTRYAEDRAGREGLHLERIQHHHAHLASCMADNGLQGECLGLIWDGTGLGTDGKIWGAELLRGGYESFSRLGSMRPIALPGGDAATKEIWRVAAALLNDSGAKAGNHIDAQGLKTIEKMLKLGINCPMSSGMGRLFDGVCALAGIRKVCTYEGQGAVLLEAASEPDGGSYACAFYDEDGIDVFDWRQMIWQIAGERAMGVLPGRIASRFMNTLINMALEQCLRAGMETGLNRIVLSGGVWQNMYLLERLPERLRQQGFEVYIHSRVSCNDEGLSLGQMMITEARHVFSSAT